MGYRSPELHASALSPSEYAAYTPIVAKLLEKHNDQKASDFVSRREFHNVLRDEWAVDEKLIQDISSLLPSYPSSHLSVGEVYATLRLLAHEQHSKDKQIRRRSSAPTLRDELVFIQTEPLTRHQHRPSSGATSASRENDDTAQRRQASLKIATSSKSIAQVLPSPARVKPDDKVVSTRSEDLRGSRHVKSKSAGANPSLPPSTPLLNPFRTARPDDPKGFVSPPPVPPKPTKVAATQKAETIAAPLITIGHDETSNHVDSNPFRRRSMQGPTASPVKTAGQAIHSSKPPLPPRQPASQTSGRASSPIGHGNRSEGSHPPFKHAQLINNIQPTSLLKPSRLIQEGLDAAERARSSGRSPSPNNIVTLSNSKQRPTTLPPGFQPFGAADSGSERSSRRSQQKANTVDNRRRRQRSSTLTSITTNGTTSSDSSFTRTNHQSTGRNVNPQETRNQAEPSPFADPCLIDTSLPPPPKPNVIAQFDGSARIPMSVDIIATSGQGQRNGFAPRSTGSRRSTLTDNDARPAIDHGLSDLKDLGDDVRRAAEGVGKDLEWIRGGRGGRTLGMTLPNQEDQAGREGLMQNIERYHTGSTAISEDQRMKV